MNITKRILGVVYTFFIITLLSCGGSKNDTPAPKPPVADSIKIAIDPTNVKQQMIGFGGALTWYSNWVTGNTKVNEIADLMFTDLGIDIIRFKNWYYPDNYPTDKTTTTMSQDGSSAAWSATNTLYNLAMQRNPNIKILFSSWGPPPSLKSNNKLPEGTLLKDNSGLFMYDAFAQYWNDVLDNVPFNPDYISIQNEPTFVNSGWTTCQWSNVETSSLPDYNLAFNRVYDKIKGRTKVPMMVGPESPNTQGLVSFAPNLSSNPNCGMYAYHPYDINSSTSASTITSSLQSVGNFSTKPNLMTEFSDNLDWFNTALFIQSTLLYANSSGYIYWKLSWGPPASGVEDKAMISIASPNSSSAYTVTPYYYLIKHFSKHIDVGYHRVGTSSSNSSLVTTAFISPDNSKITIVVVNSGAQAKVYFEATGKTFSSISADQSMSGSSYKPVTITSPTKSITLPANSITTVVLGV